MHPFREKTPVRRPDRAECKHYNSYRKTLREDFTQRCGYCNDLDSYRIRSFTIDHFVPQNPKGFKTTIAPNYYYNLVYACRYCNTSKMNKWPTNDEHTHNNGSQGFIDPVEQEYTDLYTRTVSGRIQPVDDENVLAHHIVAELKLWQPIHERMWKFEKIDLLIEQIELKLNNVKDQAAKEAAESIHYKLLKSWREIQKGIFVENG